MPINLVPMPVNPPTPRSGASQETATVSPTRIFDVPVPEKRGGIRVTNGQAPTILWTMVDGRGRPVDLTDCLVANASGSSVPCQVRMREASEASRVIYQFTATCTSPQNGTIQAGADLTTFRPGIYLAEIGIFQSNLETVVFSNQVYLIIEASLFATSPRNAGPPSIASLRNHLRDSSPTESRLLDDFKFDLADLAECLLYPVDYWNGALPPLDIAFTTQTYPFRAQWIDGAIARLYRLLAEWYRGNYLDYQAGGISVKDMQKGQEYDARGDQLWAEHKAWVQSRKISINMDAAWGSVGSPYGQLSAWEGY